MGGGNPTRQQISFLLFRSEGNERRHERRRNSMAENERKGAPGQGLQSANGLKTERGRNLIDAFFREETVKSLRCTNLRQERQKGR
ncbi:hypothetical protein CEXT_431191 [Caerostris extrusa]|uniref:Uncharacterized protein n=1 Tax=Caerostris extrusa TaxID=172846 RepID=A0AAV4N8X9_CAEEX|nr:hypothetical protein CEXT_431191 [Caerostris extrusa]